MTHWQKHFDTSSLLVIFATLVLFVAALFYTGFTHDLLLEAGVFLVSVKLILMSYKSAVAFDRLHEELREVRSALQRPEHSDLTHQDRMSRSQTEVSRHERS